MLIFRHKFTHASPFINTLHFPPAAIFIVLASYTQDSFHIRRKQKDECIHNSNKTAYFLKVDWCVV